MYQALQWKHMVAVLAGMVVAIFLALSWWSSPASAIAWLITVSAAITWSGFFVGLMGSKWVFERLWRLPLAQTFLFPYVAGEWTGEIRSNWPVVEASGNAFVDGAVPRPKAERHVDHLGYHTKGIKVTIEADLFSLRIMLRTDDGYSISQSMMVRPEPRGSLSGGPRLLYFYDNRTPEEKATDSSQHYGAAYLDIETIGSDIVMQGTYWTARNWREGLNTAGIITLRRPA